MLFQERTGTDQNESPRVLNNGTIASQGGILYMYPRQTQCVSRLMNRSGRPPEASEAPWSDFQS